MGAPYRLNFDAIEMANRMYAVINRCSAASSRSSRHD